MVNMYTIFPYGMFPGLHLHQLQRFFLNCFRGQQFSHNNTTSIVNSTSIDTQVSDLSITAPLFSLALYGATPSGGTLLIPNQAQCYGYMLFLLSIIQQNLSMIWYDIIIIYRVFINHLLYIYMLFAMKMKYGFDTTRHKSWIKRVKYSCAPDNEKDIGRSGLGSLSLFTTGIKYR